MTGIKITKKAADLIVFFEISSQANYIKKLQNPTWPEVASGITIGVGFDLGYTTVPDFEKAWGGLLPKADIELLKSVIGYKGQFAERHLDSVKHIVVPFQAAKKVFQEYSLITTAKQLLLFHPKSVELFPDAQGALLSLIFNRGRATKDKAGSTRRKEMRTIQQLIPNKDYVQIAAQIIAMKRLWPGIGGLLTRRDKEAALVVNSNRQYSQDELINL